MKRYSIICSNCKKKVKIIHFDGYTATVKDSPGGVCWSSMTSEKETTIFGSCPSCDAWITASLRKWRKIKIVSVKPDSIQTSDEVESADSAGYTCTFFRMKCKKCKTTFDIGMYLYEDRNTEFWELKVLRSFPRMGPSANWKDLETGLSNFYDRDGYQDWPKIWGKSKNKNECAVQGPCPKCQAKYQVVFNADKGFKDQKITPIELIE